jgi:hypothetical protein
MPPILRQLPIFDQATTLRVPNGPVVPIKPLQIICWASITPPGLAALPPGAQRFPVVIDTGFNDNFLLQAQHFTTWAGLALQDFTAMDFLSVYGQRVPLLDVDIWLYRNIPGHRDQLANALPFRLQLDSGVGVCPASLNAPRLPLLGMRALRRNDLQLFLDSRACRLWLRTPRRFWFFGW